MSRLQGIDDLFWKWLADLALHSALLRSCPEVEILLPWIRCRGRLLKLGQGRHRGTRYRLVSRRELYHVIDVLYSHVL